MPGGESEVLPPPGVPVAASKFRELVTAYLTRLERGDEMADDDYITMVRLFNTIESDRLAERAELFARYWAAFFPAQVEPASQRLAAVPTKGMALYSAKHDLYIGGPPHPRSRYYIEGEL
jgi:hypothetical protein